MITCHLTKLETAVDSVKKSYPKLKPADAALLASALVVTGRHALAAYEGGHYKWPEEYDKLTAAMVSQLEVIQQGIDLTKKPAKSAPEEEPVLVAVGLAPNIAAGEALLKGRDDLKAKLSEVIKDGVEFAYSPMDIGWQWALDRVNWSTVSGGDLSRRIKIKTTFTEGASGLEMGTGAKKRAPKKAAPVQEAEPEAALATEQDPVADAVPAPEPAKAGKAAKAPAAPAPAPAKPVKASKASVAPSPETAKPVKAAKASAAPEMPAKAAKAAKAPTASKAQKASKTPKAS